MCAGEPRMAVRADARNGIEEEGDDRELDKEKGCPSRRRKRNREEKQMDERREEERSDGERREGARAGSRGGQRPLAFPNV